jgi:hypothetical protein
LQIAPIAYIGRPSQPGAGKEYGEQKKSQSRDTSTFRPRFRPRFSRLRVLPKNYTVVVFSPRSHKTRPPHMIFSRNRDFLPVPDLKPK